MSECIIGDVRDVLPSLPAESVQMCVTSPPYWGLRDYGVDGQLGLEPTPEEFVANMIAVFREVRRVLRDDGVLFLNLGDSYMASGTRQTGRNDTNRETPGGRGGSFRGGVRRAISCGIFDKEPEDCRDHDCLCGSLCDACRKAYQIGKSHSDALLDPKPESSPSESSRERTESPSCHLPTWDSSRPENRSEAATSDLAHSEVRDDEPRHVSLVSMPIESSPRHQEGCPPSDKTSVCRLCGTTLLPDARVSVDRKACIAGTAKLLDASSHRKMDRFSLDLAHQDFTIASHLKPKDLIGIPWRVAFALQADGWYLRQDIIWSKSNPMPESVTDRCTKAHEYLFLLSKAPRYYFDAEAIAEKAAVPDAKATWGGKKAQGRPLNGKATGNEGSNAVYTGREKRNKRSVWTVPSQPYSEAHFATFPPNLIEPCILAGSRPGDVVLDPFFGSGTTGEVCERLGRDWLGVELNPEYAQMAKRRTAQRGLGL